MFSEAKRGVSNGYSPTQSLRHGTDLLAFSRHTGYAESRCIPFVRYETIPFLYALRLRNSMVGKLVIDSKEGRSNKPLRLLPQK